MTTIDPAADPADRWRGLGTALASLAGAYLVVLLVVGAWRSDGQLTAGAAPLVANDTQLEPLRGGVRRVPGALVIEAPDAAGLAIIAMRTAPFAAADYHHVAWRIDTNVTPRTSLNVLWRTREAPNRTFTRRLQWIAPGVAATELSADDGWRGTVTGFALATQGAITQPLPVQSVTLASPSAASAIREVIAEWSTFFPFRGNSFTFPFDEERTHVLALVPATALAALIAGLFHLVRARRRQAVDMRVVWTIFLAAWLVLDTRWQLNLWRQLRTTAAQFAGRTLEAKHLAEDDHPIYALMQAVRAALPPLPVRIFFLSDNSTLRTRGGYFLFPHNVYFLFSPKNRVPAFEQVRAGDCVLMLLYDGLRYAPEQHRLVWPDGREKPVQELLVRDGATLLRVQ
ncbi:MAG: hypothetical protein ABI920_11950 [Casimicrobiaceae bacterium]